MDVARYKPFAEVSGSDFQGLYRWNQTGSTLDRDADVDALDGKLKSAGRYWSAKYMALERHKNLKRARILVPRDLAVTVSGDFIPLTDSQSSNEGVDGDDSLSRTSVVEESWEDEVLRKTREFNKLTREQPHDEKVWLAFAEFQDRVADMQPQKGARLQTLEKKISILEKAAELNPDNEDLLLSLLKAYQSRDSSDVLISRWERILIQHSGSYKLWREFLRVFQGEFSRFKVSDMRKMYAHAIQALSAACRKHFRQVCQAEDRPPNLATVQLELGLVDIFISFCRFEWQAGYQELATALFQAEIEFSLFCPSLLLTEQSKQILFEHFWNSDGARVGEEGGLGWSTWLEKEEENRQRVIQEETAHDNEGGWTGWSEPLTKNKENSLKTEKESESNVVVEEFQEEFEEEDVKKEEDNEALLKMLGIDVDVGTSGEIKDTSTWIKWSEEELSRDCVQWMPVHARAAISHNVGTPDGEADEHLSRVIMFEDVNEYLFSLSSSEARLSLVLQFIDFFGGKTSQWICTNSSTWAEKVLSFEVLPDSILQTLRRVHNFLSKTQGSSSNFSLESLLGTSNDIYRRTDLMTFLRNATLLCLSVFPRNFVLEDAALVAEEQSVMNSNPSSCSVTPCRALAKFLLKSDRQDLLLCGVYARREAFHGNIDHARRVFDMALSSIEGLPLELRSNASILYFWYAETELGNNNGSGCESSFRAMHILFCLGSGVTYSPYKSQPSNLQLLRARQGFKERIRTVQMAWVRGVIDDQSVALICSAALFEELTSGWAAGIEVLDQAFSMVLPERKSRSYQLEFMFNFYMKMLWRHRGQSSLSKCWESILQGLQIFPFSPELLNDLIEVGHLYTTPNKLRWVFDDCCQKKPSVVVWLFALSFEMSKGGSQHRIRGLFERALASDRFHNSVVLWRCYIAYEMKVACNPSAARRNFFRAIHACPWSKKLWLDGFLKLNSTLSAKELSDLQEVMRDKELNLRTDIYEILLQDELWSMIKHGNLSEVTEHKRNKRNVNYDACIICDLSLHSLPPDGEGISLELWWPKGGGGASYWLGHWFVALVVNQVVIDLVVAEKPGGGELCGDGPEGGGESLGGDGPGAGESEGVESAGGGGGYALLDGQDIPERQFPVKLTKQFERKTEPSRLY
ncbi:protein NRDE2 homolog isoform X1 [Prunus yedoensis var. nudiflora]|uniref:Protein NRDE2 homolog isoform X1 n=1 Tax=Prunus yedoensis var. nudiflora TaxID=2094558 RepID=A0A314ZEY4_PRUYE|nr:protein NRDE2 homolog isoform X1 [Prunus yedoensis var. nudiflora]